MYVVISRKYTGEVVLPDDTNQLMANLEAMINGTKAFNHFATNDTTVVVNLNADMIDGAHKSTDSTFASTSDNLIPTEKAIKEYISNTLAINDVVFYKGQIDCSTNPNYPVANAGWVYIVSSTGKIGGPSGLDVQTDGFLICKVDNSPSGDQATVGDNWTSVRMNTGDLTTSTGLTVIGGTGATVGSGTRIGIATGYYLPTDTDHSDWDTVYTTITTAGNFTTSTGLTVTGGLSSVLGLGIRIGIASGYYLPNDMYHSNWDTAYNAVATAGNLTTSTGLTVIGGTDAILGSGVTIGISSGYYLPVDADHINWDIAYNAINTVGNFTTSTGLSVTGGTGAVIGSGVKIGIAAGYHLPTTGDQSTWNGKQNALSFGDLETSTGLVVSGSLGAVIGTGSTIGIASGYYLPTTSDQSNWDSKQDNLTIGNFTTSTGIVVTGGTNSIIGSGTTIGIASGYYLPTNADKISWDNGGGLTVGDLTTSTGLTVTNGENSVLTSTGTKITIASGYYLPIAGIFIAGLSSNNSPVLSIGNVSIETWHSTLSTLQIGSNANISGHTASGASKSLYMAQNAYYNTSSLWKYQDTDEASLYKQESGNHIFYSIVSGTADATIIWNEICRLTNNGSLRFPASEFTRKIILYATNEDCGNEAVCIGATSSIFNFMIPSTLYTFNFNAAVSYGGYAEIFSINPANTAALPVLSFMGDTNTGIFHPAADTLAISTNSTERLRINNTGEVGIGVTPKVWTSGFKILQIGGMGSLMLYQSSEGASDSWLGLGNNYYYDSGNKYLYNGYASSLTQQDGHFSFTTGPNNTGGSGIAITTWTERLRIANTGEVGIGVVPESWDVSIMTPLQIGAYGCIASPSNTSYNWINLSCNTYYNNSLSKYIGNFAASSLQLSDGTFKFLTAPVNSSGKGATANFTERMRIANTGEVGIGVTPQAWLTSYSILQIGVSGSLIDNNTDSSSDGDGLQLGNNWYYNSGFKYILNEAATNYIQSPTGHHKFLTAPVNTHGADYGLGFTERLRINNNGHVSINHPDIGYPLGVYCGTLGYPAGSYIEPFGVVIKDNSQDELIVRSIRINTGSTGWDSCAWRIQRKGDASWYSAFIQFGAGITGGDHNVCFGFANTTYLTVKWSGSITANPQVYADVINTRILYIDSVGNIGTQSSTARHKTNIKDITDYSFLFNLKPKTFEYRKRLKDENGDLSKDKYGRPLFRESGDGQLRWGLIAEEVDKVKKEFVFYDKDKKPSGVRYEDFISILIKVVQDQKLTIDDLESRLSVLENK